MLPIVSRLVKCRAGRARSTLRICIWGTQRNFAENIGGSIGSWIEQSSWLHTVQRQQLTWRIGGSVRLLSYPALVCQASSSTNNDDIHIVTHISPVHLQPDYTRAGYSPLTLVLLVSCLVDKINLDSSCKFVVLLFLGLLVQSKLIGPASSASLSSLTTFLCGQ